MNKNLLLLSSVLALAAAACGDNLTDTRPDARQRFDAPPGSADARVDAGTIDAAAGSTVTVTAAACPGTPDHTLTNVGQAFRLDGAATDNPAITLNAGDTIEWSTPGSHNFSSATGTPAAMVFTSGAIGAPGPICLTFTAAHAAITYQCDMHPSTMNGTLTVN